jgi:hypothetical protein
LHHNLRFSVDGQDDGVTGTAHLLEEVSRVSFEVAKGMDISADVEHKRLALNLHLI